MNSVSYMTSKSKFKIFKSNEKENATFQNLWDTAKTVLGRNFMAILFMLNKSEGYQINNLIMLYL